MPKMGNPWAKVSGSERVVAGDLVVTPAGIGVVTRPSVPGNMNVKNIIWLWFEKTSDPSFSPPGITSGWRGRAYGNEFAYRGVDTLDSL